MEAGRELRNETTKAQTQVRLALYAFLTLLLRQQAQDMLHEHPALLVEVCQQTRRHTVSAHIS
jgi:hypothetical protein